jgi:thiamine kinase-like enzyme
MNAKENRMDHVRAFMSNVPLFVGQEQSATIEQIGGLTNQNFKIAIDSGTYVLRIPGKGTEEYFDRKADEQAGRICSEEGVGAELAYYDVAKGIQVTRFVEGSVPMSTELLKQDHDMIRRAARAFRLLHTCGRPFLLRFDNFEKMEEYAAILRKYNADLPEGYTEAQKEAEVVREALAANPPPLAPCHNDPAPENLVDTGTRAYILDWEFGGNNDPIWDLGDFAVESAFDDEQDRILLDAYYDGDVPDAMRSRLVLQKAMVFLLWTLYGVMQVVYKNPTAAYHFPNWWGYAMDRFTRCQEIMNGPDFERHLEAVRKG